MTDLKAYSGVQVCCFGTLAEGPTDACAEVRAFLLSCKID